MDVKLEVYEGPLDLLLRLIARSEIDIHDIPISQITDEYMREIAKLPPNMQQMSEFVLMAATLLEIKSKMLLPRAKPEEPEEDPREALAQRLIAHKQSQELADKLGALQPIGERLLGAGDKEAWEQLAETAQYQPVMDLISLPALVEVFESVMRRVGDKIDTVRSGYGEMPKEKFSVTDKVSFIKSALQKTNRLRLSALFFRCVSRREMVVTFLAILEMMRRGLIFAKQTAAFDDVEIQGV